MPTDELCRFKVNVISAQANPQQIIYAAMHQDYSEHYVWDERDKFPDEDKCGEIIVRRLLAGGRGHWGPLEHPQIVLAFGHFPHSTMQQMRTHRLTSFDVQSFRYTGDRIVRADEQLSHAKNWQQELDIIDEVLYYRPVGTYNDRHGNKVKYTQGMRVEDMLVGKMLIKHYAKRIREYGLPPEMARGNLPFDVRQSWVMSSNLRSILHIHRIRSEAGVQLEAQKLCELTWPLIKAWAPAVAEWWEKNGHKLKLAP